MSNDSQKCAPTFGAGQKNNLSHGPVAQVTMAPLYMNILLNNLEKHTVVLYTIPDLKYQVKCPI